MITALQTLKAAHGGDVEVTVWQYAGGNDDLCDVLPVFNTEYERIILQTSVNDADISR